MSYLKPSAEVAHMAPQSNELPVYSALLHLSDMLKLNFRTALPIEQRHLRAELHLAEPDIWAAQPVGILRFVVQGLH